MPFAVIMAGGRGERLWPLSTPEKPKQFLKLGGRQTMLQETVARISPLIPEEDIYIVIPKEFTDLVLAQLDIPQQNIIIEPIGRNTAPCIGLAAIMLKAKDPHGVMVVLPADHVIKRTEEFLKILKRAIEVASAGTHLVTLGINPDHPATGYGYIRRGKPFAKHDGIEIYHVEEFTEKPNEKTAERFLCEGGYYWNSGMFVWRMDTILAEIAHYMSKLYAGLLEIKGHLGRTDLDRVITKVYREQEAISIDYGVMERSSHGVIIPTDIGWSDVGDWSAVDAIFAKDKDGNIVQARHLGANTDRSIIISSDNQRLIATIGLENIVIVDTKEALLVMDKSAAQEVKETAKRAAEISE
ncbi:mannose-1-phosphate guanylyltransferase [Candidatus Acetothermia bacterium]|nr:mannose-1-phosphate guanylyltransferase [Candidatus Acetothermia bacterium]MCI2427643.1 mannose-1-phosphate guanylyltransferase [Candidatus Acetothermia bacterium]MCI2428840.1 mannose-1-phosphate guanylyltransferase [Candidatus Acetothermia bacterium]